MNTEPPMNRDEHRLTSRRLFDRCSSLFIGGLFFFLCTTAIAGEWVVDENGRCVEKWSPSSLERGPVAVGDAPLVPMRVAAGAGPELRQPGRPGFTGDSFFFRALYVPLNLVTGVQAALSQASFGVMDVATGGYFGFADDDPKSFTVKPEPLGVLGPLGVPRLAPHPIDACGRVVYPLALSNDVAVPPYLPND